MNKSAFGRAYDKSKTLRGGLPEWKQPSRGSSRRDQLELPNLGMHRVELEIASS